MAKKVSRDTTGNCFLCGAEHGKAGMEKHIEKEHAKADGEVCIILKVDDPYRQLHWLFLDIAADKPLSALDQFLREIWMECCGHMSGFFSGGRKPLGITRKVGELERGGTFTYEYDFGTTTEVFITVLGETRRPKQKAPVRLLARNAPPPFECRECKKPAVIICTECMFGDCEEGQTPFFCQTCADKHADNHSEEMHLPVVNSPRMGECAYTGDLDSWTFDPKKVKS